ncbi:MAG: hypothetical protein ACLPIX_19890 [Rhodomicrobium sp.]
MTELAAKLSPEALAFDSGEIANWTKAPFYLGPALAPFGFRSGMKASTKRPSPTMALYLRHWMWRGKKRLLQRICQSLIFPFA